MNKQGKMVDGLVVGGIEWTKTVIKSDPQTGDTLEKRGSTWNPVGGCFHDCRWTMPDGTEAICYAKTVAERVAQQHYDQGFEHHYWNPHRLEEPLNTKEPQRIFWDSMADIFGHWVPEEHVLKILKVARKAHWHTFQSLTKNAPGMLKYADKLPPNVWPGVSTPPDHMWGKKLHRNQQAAMLRRTLSILNTLADKGFITWISFEPLSWDVSQIVAEYPQALRWAVIGAATNGPKKYQPSPSDVQNLLDVLDDQGVKVFFKGNLEWEPWREEFPTDTVGCEVVHA